MDKKYNDIHIIYNNDEYTIREVTEVYLQNKGGFTEISYKIPIFLNKPMKSLIDSMSTRIVVPCVEGLKIYID